MSETRLRKKYARKFAVTEKIILVRGIRTEFTVKVLSKVLILKQFHFN